MAVLGVNCLLVYDNRESFIPFQRIASRKSSFLLFKLTCSHDVAPVFSPRPQLRSSAGEQEKNKAYVREKEEDFA
jgi:hypothetical protein